VAQQTRTRTNDKQADGTEARPKAPARRRITRRKKVEEHVRSYFEAIAARDLEAVGGHWREDGIDDVVPLGVKRGRDEIVAMFRDMFAAAPDLETTVSRVVAGEKLAAVEWRMRGTFTGAPFEGIEATGKPIDLRGVDLFEVEDGQIVANSGYYDGADFARQIGMLPPQDSGAERAMTTAFNTVTRLRRAVNERRPES
jgi:steroid delta-isomerase-like uncharacterized protein